MNNFRLKIAHRTARRAARLLPVYFSHQLQNPVFLVGCGRSGTTMLKELLATHTEVACFPGEANTLWHPRLYPWHDSDIDVSPIWLDPNTFTETSLDARPPDWDSYIRAVFGAFQTIAGRRIFLNKTVMANFMIPKIQRLFPEARFIHLYRHGLAVALSYPRKEREKFRSHEKYRKVDDIENLQSLHERYASYWNHTILELERQRDELQLDQRNRWLELNYSDLCAHPRSTIRDCLQFMQVDPDCFDYSQCASIQNQNYKFENFFDDEQRNRLTDIIEPALQLKGLE